MATSTSSELQVHELVMILLHLSPFVLLGALMLAWLLGSSGQDLILGCLGGINGSTYR
jgi:hypothetical protein